MLVYTILFFNNAVICSTLTHKSQNTIIPFQLIIIKHEKSYYTPFI